jgi:transcriptional regulator with XRE-family HTH domain
MNIKARRKELGITQEKLAELVNLSYQMVKDIEGCRTWVSDTTLQSLAKVLEVEVYELLYPRPSTGAIDQNYDFFSHLVGRFHTTIKADIEQRMDEFFGKLL